MYKYDVLRAVFDFFLTLFEFFTENTSIFNLISINHDLPLQQRPHSGQQPKGHRDHQRHHRQSRKWPQQRCMELIPTGVHLSNKWLSLHTVLVS